VGFEFHIRYLVNHISVGGFFYPALALAVCGWRGEVLDKSVVRVGVVGLYLSAGFGKIESF
jgi:hypothetical protein